MAAGNDYSLKNVVIAHLGFLLMVSLWGALFPAVEQVLKTWDVVSTTAGRHTFAVLALLVALAIGERRFPLHRRFPWRRLMLLGFFGMTVTSLLTTLSVSLSSGASAAIASATNPITSAITARLLQNVPLLPGVAAGAAISTIGGLVSIFAGHNGAVELGGGELLIVVSNVIWTWYSMMAQRWLTGYSQLQITGLTAAPGLVGLYAVVAIGAAGGWLDIRIDLSPLPVLLIIFAGAVSVAVGNFLWHFGVSRVGVTIAAMYNNLIPVVAVGIAYWAGTEPSLLQLVGGAIIIAGVLFAQIMAMRRRPVQPAAFEA